MSVEELVKRLRDMGGGDHAVKTCHEAADKLEELAAEAHEWKDRVRYLSKCIDEKSADEDRLKTALAEAKRENEAVRRALTLIDALDPEEHVYGCSADALRGLVIQMGQLARNAGGNHD